MANIPLCSAQRQQATALLMVAACSRLLDPRRVPGALPPRLEDDERLRPEGDCLLSEEELDSTGPGRRETEGLREDCTDCESGGECFSGTRAAKRLGSRSNRRFVSMVLRASGAELGMGWGTSYCVTGYP